MTNFEFPGFIQNTSVKNTKTHHVVEGKLGDLILTLIRRLDVPENRPFLLTTAAKDGKVVWSYMTSEWKGQGAATLVQTSDGPALALVDRDYVCDVVLLSMLADDERVHDLLRRITLMASAGKYLKLPFWPSQAERELIESLMVPNAEETCSFGGTFARTSIYEALEGLNYPQFLQSVGLNTGKRIAVRKGDKLIGYEVHHDRIVNVGPVQIWQRPVKPLSSQLGKR